MKPNFENQLELTVKAPRSIAINGGHVTTPPDLVAPVNAGVPVRPNAVETASQKISRLLRGKEIEADERLTQLARNPEADLEYSLALFINKPFLAIAVSLAEGFSNVVIPSDRRQSTAQAALIHLTSASFHAGYRMLDIKERICPEINERIEPLFNELQLLKAEFEEKIGNGTIEIIDDSHGRQKPVFVSQLKTEPAAEELFTRFTRLSDLEDIFESNRFKKAVKELCAKPRNNLDYAKRTAYQNKATIQSVVLAEREGETKAAELFAKNRMLDNFKRV